MIVIDTTILVCAVGDSHPLREPCRKLFVALREGRVEARTTIEVVQEFAHIRARRRMRANAAALARAYTVLLKPYPVDTADLLLGLTLFEQTPALGAFDAVLAATALNRQAEALISADKAFGDVTDVRWIDPAMQELDALLRS